MKARSGVRTWAGGWERGQGDVREQGGGEGWRRASGRGGGMPLKLGSREQLSVPSSPLGDRETHLQLTLCGKKNISAVHETYDHTGNKTECSGNNIDSYWCCGL